MKLTELENVLFAKILELNNEVNDNSFWYEEWKKLNDQMQELKTKHPVIFNEKPSDANV